MAVLKGIGIALKGFGKALRGKGKVSPTIKSVPPSKNVTKKGMKYSIAKTKLEESYKRSQQVDKNYKIMKDSKKAFKDAKKDLQRMVDTKRADKIGGRVHRRGVKFESDDLNTKRTKKAKGGMAGKKFPDLSGDGKVTKKDILMGRGVIKK